MGDNSASTRVLVTIFSVYLCTVPFAAGYYNWQYARENGFMTWLLLGEIVPSAKSLVWPYFALQSRAQAQQQSRPQLGSSDPRVIGLTKQQVAEAEINKFLLAIKYSQQASYLLASDLHENLAEHPKLQEIIADRQKALEAADSVDADILNTVYPELGKSLPGRVQIGSRVVS